MARNKITYSQHPNHAARSAHAKGDKQFRTYDTSAIRPKQNSTFAIAGIVVLVVLLVLILFGVFNFVRGCGKTPLVARGTEVTITITEGEGAKSVGKTLVDEGLISNSNEFVDRINAMGEEGALHPGTYTLVGGQSIDEIIKVLQTPVAATTFTVPEGSTVAQTAAIVADATGGRISAEEFIAAASDASVYVGSYEFLVDAGSNSLEGFLFPKTYPYDDASTADSIIRMMLDQYSTETAGLDWSYAESQGLTHYDVLKLASIIEKESNADHRATVASVFYNRMALGMQLQSDATVAYVVGHDPTAEDVATENEYNTYFITGLTPTPINSPGIECLQAACAPDQTSYYYFYFEDDGNGGLNYYFSETYEDHQATYE
ncbi:MAG: endolytic transglycosylase MltG [Eggerthellaceae bacterium]|nr:endolytic transglycosylase MltG [Eggerthellaceae bacterium]